MAKSKVQPKTEAEKMQKFIKGYQALVKETGYGIVNTPAFKKSADLNCWLLVLQPSIGKVKS